MNTLAQLAGRVTGSFLPVSRNPHLFINEIPEDLPINYNCEWVASVISSLLTSVYIHTKDNCLRLSARKYGYIIVFEVHKPGYLNVEPLKSNLAQLQTMAEKIGGCINIGNDPVNGAVISFSFPNLPIAA